MSDVHHEIHFEEYIVSKLKAQGWLHGVTDAYNKEYALYPEDLIAWIQQTQKTKWDKLVAMNGDKATDVLMDRLSQALESKGTIHTLRRGFSIAGCGTIDLSEAAPEDLRNEQVVHRYKSNRLRVVQQLKYHPAREFAIDLVFFINGLAVATVELKTDFTQSVEAAMDQYKLDRLPLDPKTKRKEPLLTFQRGAVVHFAMSDSEIQMTTKLDGQNTFFLPFNKGRDGHAGNPARADGEYPVAYFWEEICQPDAWLRIFHSFVYTEKKEVVDLKGNWSTQQRLMFPRFHQWEAVNKMIADAKLNGPGMAYLCEHSAGSGKTSTIAWTAHDLVKLRNDDGKAIFDAVIIVTDRTVLDGQLQDAVQQLDHQKGLIAAIDRQKTSKSKSEQLTEALLKGTPIIVVTIQTFPYAMEAILTEQSLKDKSFGVIIDEAHASQTGTTASKLQATLAMKSKTAMADMTIEELLTEMQQSRVRPKNVSQFAFTATPKHSTLTLFGRLADPSQPASKDNLPRSFHKYPMRQAIEEEFILDVLQGYVPYKTAYNLSKKLVDEKRVDGKEAKRALAKWMALHPTNVTQKVEFIIEHFSKSVAHLLGGKAKAMVVTSSRAAAVRYKKGFDKYIEMHPEHAGIRALVAFSGKLTGEQVSHATDSELGGETFVIDADAEFTEASMNPDIGSTDLRIAFDRPEYRVMLVADKFQTGFDQPKLVAMYLDKKIANSVEIVQTLSRLNRMHPGKDKTFVIDFVNDPESIRSAFATYDSGAHIDSPQDLNVVYGIKDRLDETGIYYPQNLDQFREARFKLLKEFAGGTEPQHKALFAATQEPTDAFNDKLKHLRHEVGVAENNYQKAHAASNTAGMKAADHQREELSESIGKLMEFKSGLGRFVRTYAYIAQLIDLGDPELENYAAFAKLLAKRLDGVAPEAVDLNDVVLGPFTIQPKTPEGGPDEPSDPPVLPPVGPGGSAKPGGIPVYLQEIIQKLNSLFGDIAPLSDKATFANQIAEIARANSTVMAQVQGSQKDLAMKGNLPGEVDRAVVRAMSSHNALATLLLKADPQSRVAFTDLIYDLLKHDRKIDLSGLEV